MRLTDEELERLATIGATHGGGILLSRANAEMRRKLGES